MKTFKDLSIEYSELLEGAKLKKEKKWVPNEKGELKKVLKKFCVDSNGNKAQGYKLVDGKKCEKMNPAEIKKKEKSSKKAQKTKKKNSSKIEIRARKIMKKKISKGLVTPPEEVGK
jgi:hypothetical protein